MRPAPPAADPDAAAGDDLAGFSPTQRAALGALPTVGSVSAAARCAGVSRRSVYRWAADDPAFAAALAEAREDAADAIEEEAHRRAVSGVRVYKFLRDGTPINHPETGEPYYEHAYSDRLLEILMKAGRPAKYRDRSDVRQSGTLTHEHGTVAVVDMVNEMREDPEYLDFLRARCVAESAAGVTAVAPAGAGS